MASLGSFGVAKVKAEDTFDFFDKTIRVNPSFGELDVADFMEAASSLEEESSQALTLLKVTMRACVHPEDFDEFWTIAKREQQGTEDLMGLLIAVTQATANRPTVRSSDSSDGPQLTSLSSVDGSSSRVIARLEESGRPDLALMVQQAEDSRASA